MDDRTKRNEGRGKAARIGDVGTEKQEVVGLMQHPSGESKRVACKEGNVLAMELSSVLTQTFNG